jgi:polysaccharide biosynthesis protein PslG
VTRLVVTGSTVSREAVQAHGPAVGGAQAATLAADERPETLQLGVTVLALWRDWADHEALLDLARDNGAGWVRIDSGWCSLEEQGPGKISGWYEDRMDAVVEGAVARGLRVQAMVGCAPGWAGGDGLDGYPDDPAQFTRIMDHLADRYRGKVQAWEIGNEPDCVGGCPNGSPEDYVPFLRAGYLGVKQGDPAATVVTGGVSGVNVEWLQRMYDAGAHGWFDALAVHPYLDPIDAPPDAAPENRVYRLTSLPAFRALMVRHGDGDKPVWFTEFGWSNGERDGQPGVDEQTQARYLRAAVEQVQERYPYVTHAMWFTIRDRDDWTDYENLFGLVDVDLNPKPALAAFRGAADWLAQQ